MKSKSWSNAALMIGAAAISLASAAAKPGAVSTKTPLPTWTPDSQLEQQLGINNKMYDFAIRPPDGWQLVQRNGMERGRLAHEFVWVGPRQNNQVPTLFLFTVPMSRKAREAFTPDQALKEVLDEVKSSISIVSPTITRTKVQHGLIAGNHFSRLYFKFPLPQINNTVHGFIYTGYFGARELIFAAINVEPGWTDTGELCEASVLTFHKA